MHFSQPLICLIRPDILSIFEISIRVVPPARMNYRVLHP